jgi:hypothetical protein
VTGYMHPGWGGRVPWEGILDDTPPDPPDHRPSHRPAPAPAEPWPTPDWTPPPPRPARAIPRWLACQLAGSDCVGPGAGWDAVPDD